MNGRTAWLIGGLLAVAVPGLALACAGAGGQVVSPFAGPRVLLVHLFATLPLSVGLALWSVGGAGRGWAMAWAAAGAVLALVTFAAGPLAGPALDRAGFGDRLLIRAAWCLVLELPWCAAAVALAGATIPRPARLGLALAAAAALAPPAAYADRLGSRWTTAAGEALSELRLDDARRLLAGLIDLGIDTPIDGQPPRRQLARVEEQWRALETAVARPLPDSAPAARRIERARLLGVLGRLDDAAALVEPLADTDASAAQLIAVVRQKQGRYDESSTHYRTALNLLGDGPGAIAGRVDAYDGLAFNARAAGRPAEAEAAYTEALARLPGATGHFHFQLGRHFQLGGRPGDALAHLHEAIRVDPARYAASARPLIDELRRATPGCLLRTGNSVK